MPAAITNFVDLTILTEGATAEAFEFGALIGVFLHTETVNRQDGPYQSLAEVVAAGFTSVATPQVHAWASAVFSQSPKVKNVYIGRQDIGDATWTVTMDAVQAADPESFYLVNVETRVEADILLVAAWTQANKKLYIAQTADAAVLAGTAGNVMLDLQAAGYTRTACIYHATSTGTDGYLDGAWSSRCGGFNLDSPKGRGIWMYKALSGVTYDPVTSAQATEVYDANGNLYGRNLGLSFTSKGTTAAGAPQFIDITTTVDWLEKRANERVLSGFVGTPTVQPYTNDGINAVSGWLQEVLDKGVSFGHFSPDDPPIVDPIDASRISAEVKATRVLTLTVRATFAGGIQKLVATINVGF